MAYEEHSRRWFVDENPRREAERRDKTYQSLRHLMLRGHWLSRRDEGEAVKEAHRCSFESETVRLLALMRAEPEFHPALQRIGLSKRLNAGVLQNRFLEVLHSTIPGWIHADPKCDGAKSLKESLHEWVAPICSGVGAGLSDPKFQIFLGYEALLAYALGEGWSVPPVDMLYRSWSEWAKRSRGDHYSFIPKSAVVTNIEVRDAKSALEALSNEDQTWTAVFSKSIHWWKEEGEPGHTQQARGRLLIDIIDATEKFLRDHDPDDVLPRVAMGLQTFEHYATNCDERHLGRAPRGRFTELKSCDRLWMWGKVFCDQVLERIGKKEIDKWWAVTGLLIQPLPAPGGRSSRRRRQSAAEHPWTLSYHDVGKLLRILSTRNAPIARPIWELASRGTPRDLAVSALDRCWGETWKNLDLI